MLDGVQVGGWHVSAASIIGASHLAAGGVRQDAYNFIATNDGYLIIAIADGLGSRPFSQLGAALFCEGVTQAALAPERTPPAASELLHLGAEHVGTASQASYRVPLPDVAFVAAVAVLRPAGSAHAGTAEIARIGDVSAFATDPGEPLTELFATDDGPVNVVSYSLPATAPPEPQMAQTGARMLVLVTDGLANDLRTSPGVRTWLAERWTEPIGPFAFGDSLRYQRQGSHDDRTAVVAWRVEGSGEDT
jgi:serine/threonine protein phosphatase PrpC